MAARNKSLRYIVTGYGLQHKQPSYADAGPAISRTITAASDFDGEGTWYARDSITGEIIGYSERDEHGDITTTDNRKKAKR